MEIRLKTFHLLTFFLFIGVGLSQDCDVGYVYIENLPESCLSDGNCFYQSDLEALQVFIDNSQGGSNPTTADLPPTELGNQIWEEGRLTDFCFSGWGGTPCFMTTKIYGEIPENIGKLTQLKVLDISANYLSGDLPGSFVNLGNLTTLYLESNYISGEIPQSLDELSNLTRINLEHNQLSGGIPASIGSLTQLKSFFISGNQLTGPLPTNLFTSNPDFVNISVVLNNLSVPSLMG